MNSPSMLRHHGPFTDSTTPSVTCDDLTNQKTPPYPCYQANNYSYQRNCHENLVYVMPSDSNESSEPVTKNAGSRWREDETEALVEIWRDKICQTRWWKQSKGVRVNKEMWEEIAQLLAEREVFRTPSQCQIRMKNLLQFYRQTVDSRKSEKAWVDLPVYFDIVDRIMTRKENTDTGGGSTVGDKSYGSENDMSPSNESQDKIFDEDKDVKVSISSISDGKKNNKRKSACSLPYDILPEVEPTTRLPSTNTVTVESHPSNQPPPHFQTYPVSGEFSTTHNSHDAFPLYQPYFKSREKMTPTRGYCSGNCCNGLLPKKACFNKNKEYQNTLSENSDNVSTTTHPHNHTGEQQNHVNNLPNDSKQGDHLRAPPQPACNYFNQQMYRSANGHLPPYRLPEGFKNMNPYMTFQQDLIQLQYKQMETFLGIERKRLEVEEERLREEKEANNRNGAFLLEAVKILAETFRKKNNE